MTSNFQPIKDNLILIYKIEEKNNFGAKLTFKQAHFDLSLVQLSPSFFYGTTILIVKTQTQRKAQFNRVWG